MAAFGQMMITNRGLALQAKAQTGTALQFTAIKIGDGQLSGQAIPTLPGLISQKLSLPIGKAMSQTGKVTLGAYLSNASLSTGFFFREIGIFANDPAVGEILFAYANSGTTAEYIPAGGGPDIVEKYIDLVAIIQSAANVSAVIDNSLALTPLVRKINTEGGLQGGGDFSLDRTLSIAPKGVTQDKIGDKAVGSAQLANGAATDTVIGNRTITDTATPTGDSGAVTTLFGWLANMVKAITGKSSWRIAPATTLEAAKAHADDTTRHITAAERTAWNAVGAAGGVTDTIIGSRTINDATAPTGDTGTVTTLFGWIANMIKAITGKSSWRTAPATTLEAAKVHADDTTRHITAAERTAWNAVGAAGGVTDTIIGNRTINDTTGPAGDTGTTTTLFGWLGYMIKAITGGATWRTLPGMTIAAIKTILDTATSVGTASTLMKRDASGRAQVAAPSAAADIARKDTVDAVQTNLNTHANLGASAHGATSAPTASAQMARDAAGRAQVQGPSTDNDIANKWYADNLAGKTTGDVTYYVRTDGNDSNTGTANTAAGAFKTISKAVSMIPQTVNHTVMLNIGAGSYVEGVSLKGFTGNGVIRINGAASVADTHLVSSLYCTSCSCQVIVTGIKATIANATPFYIESSRVELWYCKTDVQETTLTQGIYVTADSNVSCVGCSISNRTTAIISHYNSHVNVDGGAGSNLRDRFIAQFTSMISHYSNPLFASTYGDAVFNGGTIFAGGYPGAINPWGDNTIDSRPKAGLYLSADQSITANVTAKLALNTSSWNIKGMADSTNRRLIIPETGDYIFSARVGFAGNTTNSTAGIALHLNSSYSEIMQEGVMLSTMAGITISGTTQLRLNAGDVIEIFVYASYNATISSNPRYTYAEAKRVG
jgi:hypothetical protein